VGLLERERRVAADRDEEVELGVGRAPAGDRLAERQDREHVAVGVAARDEQLVARAPRAVVLARSGLGHPAGADVGGLPVERARGIGIWPDRLPVFAEPWSADGRPFVPRRAPLGGFTAPRRGAAAFGVPRRPRCGAERHRTAASRRGGTGAVAHALHVWGCYA